MLRFILIGILALTTIGGLIACSPLTALNALTPSSSYQLTENVAYGQDPRQQLDIYRPTRHGVSKPAVVVFFYGGRWNSGDRQSYKFVGEALAARGIMAVIADYRVYPQVRYPSFVEDSAQAVAWTAKHINAYGGDAKRLFVMGHSAGAYNAAMVALDKRWLAKFDTSPAILKGWIGLAGPYDFLPIDVEDIKPTFWFPNTPADSQPLAHATAEAPPALLLTGAADTVVNPVRNTVGLSKALQAQHVSVQVIQYPDITHVTLIGALARPLRHLAPVLDDVVAFVERGTE